VTELHESREAPLQLVALDSPTNCRVELFFQLFWNIPSTPQLSKAARVSAVVDHAAGRATAFARRYCVESVADVDKSETEHSE
jgi:hypothetical protein